MALYAEIALPLPLEQLFTYTVRDAVPLIGARVLVPFSGQHLVGIVMQVHGREPDRGMRLKAIQHILDVEPVVQPELMRLAEWIAQYYVAPLGEVLRGMVPARRAIRLSAFYRITPVGSAVLHEGAERGSSRRSRLSPEDQGREYAVLNALESGDTLSLSSLRPTGATKALLSGMVRKRWLSRDITAGERDTRTAEKVAVLTGVERPHRLSAGQRVLLQALDAAEGRLGVLQLQRLDVSPSTLATLVRRGLVTLERPKPTATPPHAVNTADLTRGPDLNEAQRAAVSTVQAAIASAGFQPFLLFGVTGSGKTAVYFELMRNALNAGKSALLLVPEITLTPAMTAQLYATFGSAVAVLHSQLAPAEREEQWQRIRSGAARVALGTRSAIFAPFPDLGLIVVDEEHDSSYKQEETPRYHGRDVAVMRAKLLGIPVLLGSATPSLESWRNAQAGRYTLLRMQQRVANRPLPTVELVDMRTEFRESGNDHLFSRRLIEQVGHALEAGQQAIILLNRRGYSRVVLCRACGEAIECENCAVAMTLHRAGHDDMQTEPAERLECHYCGFTRAVPLRCPHCASEHLHSLGAGSQQGEERLQEIFPSARIGRMDRDAVRHRGDMERLLQRLHSGEINLLVGTQMLAKGHDIHGVTTVGVVGFDHALGMPDFRAAERVFQLLTQVAGRAGRGSVAGQVLVQTYHPDHYAVRRAAAHDFEGFARQESQFRLPFHYPPFGVLANVLVRSPELAEAIAWANTLRTWFQVHGSAQVQLLGPAAAPIVRIKQIFRYHLMLKARRRTDLQRTLSGMLAFAAASAIPRTSLVIDVDPVNLS